MQRWVVVLGWFGWMSSGLLSAATAGEVPGPNRELFLKYCSSCHGSSAKGDGPVAAVLTPKPADLTELAKRNGGEFDAFTVYQKVSGRPPVAHGDSDMPVWGEVLRMEPGGGGDPGGADPRVVQLKLAKIVEYLRAIQVK